MREGTDVMATLIKVPASGSRSDSDTNRIVACTGAPDGNQTGADGWSPRRPMRTFLPMPQELAVHDGDSVQSRAPRKEPPRERGA